jgi:hypothetical protein
MNADKDPEVVFRSTVYLMDIERVRYSLARYLRIRLKKIENQCDYIMSTPEALDFLSRSEKEFASKLMELNSSYLGDTFYDRLRDNYKQIAVRGDELYKHASPELKVSLILNHKWF